MTACRKIPFLSFVASPYRKVKINLSGCNFNCRGCFALAKQEVGRSLSVEELVELLIKSCQLIYGDMVDDVQMTGGEPMINIDYTFSFIERLREMKVSRIGISTNGHPLDENVVKKLSSLDVNYIKLDVKAYSEEIHKQYTGESNANVLRAVNLLNKYGLNFYVRTILIPEIIDLSEIERIAKFLGQINKGLHYRIYQFSPEQANSSGLRERPTEEEMSKAFCIARSYLDNVEFATTFTAYKPDCEYIEVRADELLEDFKKVDIVSKSIIDNWDIQSFTMNQILNI